MHCPGTLPSWIGDRRNLTLMGLWVNHFTGTLPREWAGLQKLKYLWLKHNRLTGERQHHLRRAMPGCRGILLCVLALLSRG